MRGGLSVGRCGAVLIAALLAGCADPQLVALERELAAIRSEAVRAQGLELPEVPRVERVDYDLEALRSPFARRAGGVERELDEGAPVMPQAGRPAEPLEAHDLSRLQLVGTLRVGGEPSALVRAPDGEVHRLRVGNHLGLDHGRVVDITDTSLSLVELVVERGAWVERRREMVMD